MTRFSFRIERPGESAGPTAQHKTMAERLGSSDNIRKAAEDDSDFFQDRKSRNTI
jgi:hypothetical protein